MSRPSTFLVAVASILALSSGMNAAQAASDCSLKQVTAIPADLSRFTEVAVTINDTPTYMAVNTASEITSLHDDFAKRIGLPRDDLHQSVYEGNSTGSGLKTQISSLTIGKAVSRNQILLLSRTKGDGSNGGTAGSFAADYLANYDLEIDPGASQVILWSQDHCPGKVVYWSDEYFKTPVLFRNPAERRPELDVMVDGQMLHAMLATASQYTSVREAVVGKLGWTLDSADTPAIADDSTHKLHEHVVKSLTFGDLTLHNMRIEIAPINIAAHSADTGSSFAQANIEQPDIYIGMDLLRKLHLYIAYGEDMVYYTIAPPKQSVAR